MLIDLFDWHIRREGVAMNDGLTIHVGQDVSYLALYTGADRGRDQIPPANSYLQRGGLNHIWIVVDDLAAIEAKVKSFGLQTHSHADYELGTRFSFNDHDGIEFEVISYA